MREILFRGKCNGTGKWLCGDLLSVPELDRYMIMPQCPLPYRVDPATVGQFTGLLDKNGKKVFEGDIVTFGQNVYQITFECGSFSLLDSEGRMIPKIGGINDYCYSFGRLYDECMWEDGWAYDIEIIGNIHDNPELLEVDDE